MILCQLVSWGASSTTHHQLAGGGDCPALLCTGTASPQAVCAVWGTTTQEGHQGVWVGPERRKIKSYLCSRFAYRPSQGHEVLFNCPWTTLLSFITTHMEEKQWVTLQGPLDQAKKFPTDVLKPDPREAAEFPVWQVGPSVPLRRESPTTMTHLSFLVEMISIQRAGQSGHHNTSGVAGPSSTSSPEWPSTGKASFLLYTGMEEGEGRQGGASPATCDM